MMLASFQSRGTEHEVIELLKINERGIDIEWAIGLSRVMGILSGPDDDLEFHDLMILWMSSGEQLRSDEAENGILHVAERGGTE